jgi:hypothetical protein
MKMTSFRRHNTKVTLRETAETGVTETLAETLPGNTTTVNTLDLLQVFNPDVFTEPVVQLDLLTAQFETVADRATRLGMHFMQIPLELHRHLSR